MIDVDTMVAELRKHIGEDATNPDFDNASCLLLLNRSLWEILNKFKFRETEATTTISTVVDTDSYTVPVSFDALQSIAVDNLTTTARSKLARTTPEAIENIYSQKDYLRGYPTHYYRRKDQIVIWPIPSDVYTLTLFYLIGLDDLASGNTPEIPREWHELILLGAVWRAHLSTGDVDRSNLVLNHQVRLINSVVPVESKEEDDSREAGVQVLTSFSNSNSRSRSLWR